MNEKYNTIARHAFHFCDIVIIHRLIMNRDFKPVGIVQTNNESFVFEDIVQYYVVIV